MKDVYTIQEFAQLSGIEASTLRYWDDIGLFSPVKRNPENNYRYYSLAQLLALNFVTVLSDLDFPLKTIAELRNDRDPEQFLRILDKHEKEMDMEMRRLRQQYSIIHARRELINYGMRVDENEIAVMHRDDLPIMLWPDNEYGENDTFVEALATMISQATSRRINLSFPVGGHFDSIEALAKNTAQPQRFFSIDPTGRDLRQAGDYLIGFSRGYYADMGDLPQRMVAYAQENNVTISGPVYAIYLFEEICMQNVDEYLVQLCVSIEKPSPRARRR
ncbi:MAG: MerR family transcriptional regulator [Clostridiales bacterium]|nr:MerR family transcriptional regulator [Clostridiales bacterium]